MMGMRTRRRRLARRPALFRWLKERRLLLAAVAAHFAMFDDATLRRTYKLVGHEPMPCGPLELQFGVHVADTTIETTRVSTIFLALDHNHLSPGNPPVLFETIMFGDGGEDFGIARYTTWDHAEAGHARACDTVRAWYASAKATARDAIDTIMESTKNQ